MPILTKYKNINIVFALAEIPDFIELVNTKEIQNIVLSKINKGDVTGMFDFSYLNNEPLDIVWTQVNEHGTPLKSISNEFDDFDGELYHDNNLNDSDALEDMENNIHNTPTSRTIFKVKNAKTYEEARKALEIYISDFKQSEIDGGWEF